MYENLETSLSHVIAVDRKFPVQRTYKNVKMTATLKNFRKGQCLAGGSLLVTIEKNIWDRCLREPNSKSLSKFWRLLTCMKCKEICRWLAQFLGSITFIKYEKYMLSAPLLSEMSYDYYSRSMFYPQLNSTLFSNLSICTWHHSVMRFYFDRESHVTILMNSVTTVFVSIDNLLHGEKSLQLYIARTLLFSCTFSWYIVVFSCTLKRMCTQRETCLIINLCKWLFAVSQN